MNDRRFVVRRKTICFVGFIVLAAVCVIPAVVLAGNCLECHQKHGVTIKMPHVPPIKIMVDGKEQDITLGRVFQFHGDECPGAIIAYRGVQYGINLLYRNEIPERDDLLVISRTPAGGAKDCIDFLMKGDKPSEKALPPIGMEKSRDGFVFTVMRKSTCETVEVRLNKALFPIDFFPLKKKEQEKTITEDEWKRFHAHMKGMILGFSAKPAEEMFGRPEPYKTIIWGTLKPGELDRNIRKMKQTQR